MGTATFPIDEAYLIGGWLESFTWGVYTTIFAMTMYTIYQKRKEGVNRFTTVTLILLYVLATGHMSLALVRLIQGFVLYRDIIDPVFFFANISLRVNMAKDYLYITNLFLGDLIIVWRLYVVYGKNLYIAAFPALMCLGELVNFPDVLAAAVIAVGYASISQWLAPTQNFVVMDQLGTTMFSLSLAANIILTMVIVARIWYVTRRTQRVLGQVGGGHYKRILLLLIESGAFVAAAKLTEFVLFQLAPDDGIDGLNAIDVVYECMPQITGLAPTCIIYAVNKGFTQKDSYYSTQGPKTAIGFTPPGFTTGATGQTATTLYSSTGADTEKQVLRKNSSSSSSVV
ncbi:hypothetical protein C8Q77DRAFT_1075369 [Trametes polyzona]|nr:hypothetical protein C8Q77DRAFT_1075369 [Trametes polyzona]